MNASTVVLPYNETAIYDARVSIGNVVTKFDYSLSLLTVVPALATKIGNVAERTLSIVSPSVGIVVGAEVPVVTSSIDVQLPAPPDTLLAAPLPLVGAGIGSSVTVPLTSIAVAAGVPFAGSFVVRVPAADIAVAAPVPTLA
jgi:hypothetical protein